MSDNNNNTAARTNGGDEHQAKKWCVPASEMAKRTVNPIRRIVDYMKIEPNPNYKPISLSIGDPTVFGNLLPHENMLEAIEESLRTHKHNGYAPAVGDVQARKAVAEYMTTPKAPLTENDIILTSACSGAVDLCIGTLLNPGENVLIPKPGFPLYKVIALSNGSEVKYYNLLPEKEWEADIEHMESLIDEKTKCIVITNPSNPCGSVYSKQHLLDILKVADKYQLPILADEIYAYSVFEGETFYPIASLTTTVPVLSVCAISKRFLVPGWRLGWIQIHDRNDVLKHEVVPGLKDMSTRILGPNSVAQGALPRILKDTPKEWFEENMSRISDCATIAYNSISKIAGLKPVRPRGAMYMMVGIDKNILKSIRDDIHFTEDLMAKKSVFCLPGAGFSYPDYFRIVLTVPSHIVEEACERIKDYCHEVIKQQTC